MVSLAFSLQPEALATLHDALVCLSKFSESVSLEARRERLSLTALNSSKTAFASFSLDPRFFSRYEFSPSQSSIDGRFTFSIYNKALLSVFKGRILDPKGKDTTVDRCQVSLQDLPDEAECRLIIKMLSNQGVTKTYKLTYESVEVVHALFDRQSAKNHWSIHAGALKEAIEFFGPKTEQLDIYAENGRVTYTSFAEKITNGREILKAPLQTSVSLSTDDFEVFSAAEKEHIVISVRDFKSIVLHAAQLRSSLHAFYSQATHPLQFSYGIQGITCEFTLMTVGDPPISTDTPAPSVSRAQTRATSATASVAGARGASEMPPPPNVPSRTATRQRRAPGSAARPSTHTDEQQQAAQQRSQSEETGSLFIPQDEDGDARWDPTGYEEEETLGWDASADNSAPRRFRDSASTASASVSISRQDTGTETQARSDGDPLAPTQRLSQIRGLW
ncbi:Rad9-domain-containing protein [Phyllosticta citrichinensis]|uniref:DNA repair protein rad9 n=1 Tax=Phyllosticta citrichinensis TaxID=1130410 RepID=A0ABR1XIX8_9PEZI